MEENGCGPTCLSMVYCGLTGDDRWDPDHLFYETRRLYNYGTFYRTGRNSRKWKYPDP